MKFDFQEKKHKIKLVSVRMNERTFKKLAKVAKKEGVSKSQVGNVLIEESLKDSQFNYAN